MRYYSGLVFAFAFFTVSLESAGQTHSNPFQRVGDAFDERLEERGRVSGDIIMGVMVGLAPGGDTVRFADATPRPNADLQVFGLPEPQEDNGPQHICVRINSKDGRFEAVNTYQLADDARPTDGPIVYEGAYGSEVAQMRAVSLIRPGRCGDRTNIAIPSLWAERPVPSLGDALHIFVNAAGNPTYVSFAGGSADCQDVTDDTTLKYTASCVITLAALKREAIDSAVSMSLFVSRSLGEDEFKIVVLLPPGLD